MNILPDKTQTSPSSDVNVSTRVVEIATGITINQALTTLFDYMLYPSVIYYFGILTGGAIMTALSFLICLLILRLYDWSKRDWLGIETIKEMKHYHGQSKILLFFSQLLNKSDLIAFFVLSINFDPFIVTVYLRQGKFNGLSKRDWWVFTSSLLISNLYWIIACFLGITLIEWLINFISFS
jgi:hypothetical protein